DILLHYCEWRLGSRWLNCIPCLFYLACNADFLRTLAPSLLSPMPNFSNLFLPVRLAALCRRGRPYRCRNHTWPHSGPQNEKVSKNILNDSSPASDQRLVRCRAVVLHFPRLFELTKFL